MKGVQVMGNPFVHGELMTNDVGKAKSFYGQLFDWKLEDMDMGDKIYTLIKVGEGTGGGLMKNPMPNASSPTWNNGAGCPPTSATSMSGTTSRSIRSGW
jgi:predicted enzyme related to lactoylglutathione lyase